MRFDPKSQTFVFSWSQFANLCIMSAAGLIAVRLGYPFLGGFLSAWALLWLIFFVLRFGQLGYVIWLRSLLGFSTLAGIIILGYRISRIRLDDWTVPIVFGHILAIIALVNLLIWGLMPVDRRGRKCGRNDLFTLE